MKLNMKGMILASQVKIIDIIESRGYEKYLYKCLGSHPYRPYRRRREYLEKAIPWGFHKKILLLNGEVIGQIQYGPAAASGYPIKGKNITVLNCIWILRKAKGHNFGKVLLDTITESELGVNGVATIALEGHWSPWFKKRQMEKLGFKSIDSIIMAHKTKHNEQSFTVHLMWMPIKKHVKPPTWDKVKFLDGLTWCTAHPLYCPQTWQGPMFEAKQNLAFELRLNHQTRQRSLVRRKTLGVTWNQTLQTKLSAEPKWRP